MQRMLGISHNFEETEGHLCSSHYLALIIPSTRMRPHLGDKECERKMTSVQSKVQESRKLEACQAFELHIQSTMKKKERRLCQLLSKNT